MNASAGINNKLVFVTVILCKYFNHCVSVADSCVENVQFRNDQIITWSSALLHGHKALGTRIGFYRLHLH